MLLDSYEFLKELNKQIPPSLDCRHNITIDKEGNLVITIMSEGVMLPILLDYNEIKNGIRNNIIGEIKNHLDRNNNKIDVYYVSLKGEAGGYYEKDINNVLEMLRNSDYKEDYIIRKESMSEVVYNSLTEFTGW